MRNGFGVAIAALILIGAIGGGGCAPVACPVALSVGVLKEPAGELVVVNEDAQIPPERVKWPDGYGLRRVDGVLAVTDILGTVKARERDFVRLGGGENQDNVFVVCGMFEVGPEPAGYANPRGAGPSTYSTSSSAATSGMTSVMRSASTWAV